GIAVSIQKIILTFATLCIYYQFISLRTSDIKYINYILTTKFEPLFGVDFAEEVLNLFHDFAISRPVRLEDNRSPPVSLYIRPMDVYVRAVETENGRVRI